MNIEKFFKEIKRRNVIRETLAYVVIGWVVLQAAAIILPIFSAPNWILRTITIVLITGIPIVMILSWAYDITKKGLTPIGEIEGSPDDPQRNRKLNILIIGSLVIALLLFVGVGTTVKKLNEAPEYSIAILPFKYQSPVNDISWFSEGIREDLWQRLMKFSGLKPVSNRSSDIAMEAKFTNSEIAEKLNVRYLLEGNISEINELAIIKLKLWDSQEDLIYQDEYSGPLDNFFSLQKEVSRWVTESINFEIGPRENEVLNRSETNNREAYLLAKKGEHLIMDRNPGEAINVLKEAVKLDSTYADAYGNLALAYLYHSYLNLDENAYTRDNYRTYYNLAHNTIQKALELDKDNSRALLTMALQTNNQVRALQLFEKALNSSPNDPVVHYYHVGIFQHTDPEKSLYHFKRAFELEPLEWRNARDYINSLGINGRLNEARELLDETAALFNWDKEEKQVELAVYQSGNHLPMIDFIKKKSQKDSLNPQWQSILADLYDSAFNNDSLYLEHAQKAYALESNNKKEPNGYILNYISALIENSEYEDAYNLFSTEAFQKQPVEKQHQAYKKYFTYKGDYEALKTLIDTTAYSRDSINYVIYKVEAGLIKSLEEINFNEYNDLTDLEKACIYAKLKNRDSMYYYLLNRSGTWRYTANSRRVFDPYRDEPEFKAFQDMYYLQ